MKTVLEIIGWLMVGFTLLPTIRSTRWWIRILDFPRFQIAIIAVFTLATYVIMVRINHPVQYAWMALMGVAIGIQARFIYPFTTLAPKKALRAKNFDPENTFRLMISNVRMENKNTQDFLRIVHREKPDLLLINEPNHWWADQIKELDQVYPYCIKQPQENTYGMMFYSRLPIQQGKVHFLVESDIPSIHTLLELLSGEVIEFIGVHPRPPMIADDTDEREAELLLIGKAAKRSPEASVVAGDLNDVGWSRTTKLFQRISRLLDPRIGRGFFNTYSVHVPFFRYPLDHIFYDQRFRLVQLRRLDKFGSDHFPILVELAYQPEGKHRQPIEKADHEDHQEAEELIENGLKAD